MVRTLTVSDAADWAMSAPRFDRPENSRVARGKCVTFSGRTTWAPTSVLGSVNWGWHGLGNNEAVITFRGSDTRNRFRRDVLLIDAAVAFGTSPKGYAAHGGFTTSFRTCKDELTQIVRSLPWNIDTLHICGHSMGGALATLAAEHFIDSNFQVFLYTFGAPRVGGVPHTRFLKKKLRGRIFRYYFSGDPVTWVPMFPYVHLPGTRLVAQSRLMGGHNAYWHPRNQVIARDSDNPNAGTLERTYQWMRSSGTEPHVLRWLTIGLHKILQLIGISIGTIVFSTATVFDQAFAVLSHFLYKREHEVRPLVVRWLEGAFNVFCKFVKGVGDTLSSIIANLRYALNILIGKLRIELNKADEDELPPPPPPPQLVKNKPRPVIRFQRV